MWILRAKIGLIEMVLGYAPVVRELLEHDLISVDFNCQLSNKYYGLRMCFVKVRVGKSESIQTDTVSGRVPRPRILQVGLHRDRLACIVYKSRPDTVTSRIPTNETNHYNRYAIFTISWRNWVHWL